MVQLTRPAAARLSPVLARHGKAGDLMGKPGYGRKAIQDKDVHFIEKLPLSLKNIVSNTSMKGGQKACMEPMMEVISCLGKFDQNQSMCTKEISAFQKCYKDFKVTYEAQKTSRDKGGLPVGPNVKMTGRQMTEYMRQFPQSERTGQANPYNPYNKNR